MTGTTHPAQGKKRLRPPAPAVFAALLAGLLLAMGMGRHPAGPGAAPADAAPTFADSLAEYRADREARLRNPEGWLTVAGLFWLEPGDNVFGSNPDNAVVLPAGAAPARAGVLRLEDGEVTLRPDPGVDLRIDGEPAGERRLASDATGDPDRVTLGRLTFWVIERGDRIAIRLRDPEAELLENFTGVDFYPPDPSSRVIGWFHSYGEPHRRPMENMVGTIDTVLVPGIVLFTLDGADCSLLPVVDDPADSSFFFVFSDATSGNETYGGGRFLSARLAPRDRVVLDFNRAYNPPCAFNPYTTCPLPLPENRLSVAVRAGEKAYAGHGH
jgi:uncharacterized protein (DUF1684 family)